MFRQMADELNAARVQSIGKLLVLFRPLAEEAQARRDEKAAAAAHVQQRSKKAPADVAQTKKAAGNAGTATKPGRRDIRQAAHQRTSAPRTSAGGRARSR
jgi:hypothetical protein